MGGQTKMKSALVEFFVGAGIKPECIASYNHLGNNDGRNLASPKQFRSKEITKSNVVDDMVASNDILFPEGSAKPDHCIVIKYLPYVGDSKRAMDEYTFQIFMGGQQTVVMHNTCEDSLLATPLILDLVILTELCQRLEISTDGGKTFENMRSVLSILSYCSRRPSSRRARRSSTRSTARSRPSRTCSAPWWASRRRTTWVWSAACARRSSLEFIIKLHRTRNTLSAPTGLYGSICRT